MDRELEFAKIIKGLGQIFDKEISKEMLELYYVSLLDMRFDEFKLAIRRYLEMSEHTRFPTPAQLKAMIRPGDDQLAQDAAARVVNAIQRYGCDEFNTQRAKDYVGEIGWMIVQRQGGWHRLIQDPEIKLQVAQAQWKNIALTIIKNDRLGIQEKAPLLPSTEAKNKQIESMGAIIQSIGVKKT